VSYREVKGKIFLLLLAAVFFATQQNTVAVHRPKTAGHKYATNNVSQLRNCGSLSQRKKAIVVQRGHFLQQAARRFPEKLKGGWQHACLKAECTVSEIILLYEVRMWMKTNLGLPCQTRITQ